MRKRRRNLFFAFAALVIALTAAVPERGVLTVNAQEPEVVECGSSDDIDGILAKYTDGTPVEIILTAPIDYGNTSLQVGAGNNITLNLNGQNMTGQKDIVIQVNGGSLTIDGAGSITGKGTYAVYVQSGNFTLAGGSISNTGIKDSNAALMINTGATATISGGSLTETPGSGAGYACYAATGSTLTISSGMFTMNGDTGKSLWISGGANAVITGGGYNKSIAVEAQPDSALYSALFYGGAGRSGGLIPEGYILTGNTFTQEQNYVRTEPAVSVVRGSMITLNTNRSSVETYGEDEKAEREAADDGGIVFAGIDGKMCSTGSFLPVLDTTRVTDGNTYKWGGWMDASGTVWQSIEAYAKKNGGRDAVLTGVWNKNEPGGDTALINAGGIVSLRTGIKYTLGNGQWTVSGDSTVYNGGISFYVTQDGEYEFQMK